MKKFSILAIAALFVCAMAIPAASFEYNFNDTWKFTIGGYNFGNQTDNRHDVIQEGVADWSAFGKGTGIMENFNTLEQNVPGKEQSGINTLQIEVERYPFSKGEYKGSAYVNQEAEQEKTKSLGYGYDFTQKLTQGAGFTTEATGTGKVSGISTNSFTQKENLGFFGTNANQNGTTVTGFEIDRSGGFYNP